MRNCCKPLGLIILLFLLMGVVGQVGCSTPRNELLSKLQEQLENDSGLERRRAARQLLEMGPEATPVVLSLLEDNDVVVRRNAYRSLRQRLDTAALPHYEKGLKDESPLVRMVVVEELLAFQPRNQKILAVLRQATEDSDDEVRKLAANAFWNFHRDYLTIRKRPQWDHAIEVLQSQNLPLDSWIFRTDPGRIGHMEKWFAPKIDEKPWHASVIGKFWHEALPKKVGDYEGVAWYRLEFVAPAAPTAEFNEAVLHFAGVDESAWVWVNGHYAGAHDMGVAGYGIPFDVEVGSFLRWGESNQITVRILNAAGAGGIYKPIELQILK